MDSVYPKRHWTNGFLYGISIIFLGIICIEGFRSCSPNCRVCSHGRCQKCVAGYYGANCTRCSPRCKFSLCVPGKCNDGCIDGWYGSYCDKNCSHCSHACNLNGVCISKDKPETEKLPDVGYKILYALMSFATMGVLVTVAVFVAEKKFPYCRCRIISCVSRNKYKNQVFKDKPSDAVIWKLVPDIGSTQITSSFSGATRILPICSDVKIVPEVERRGVIHDEQDVRIVISPPSPAKFSHQPPDISPRLHHSMLPKENRNRTRNKNTNRNIRHTPLKRLN